LAPRARLVTIDWQTTDPDLSSWSYEAEVQQFKNEWREHEKSTSAVSL
jgi:hypothetical protein